MEQGVPTSPPPVQYEPCVDTPLSPPQPSPDNYQDFNQQEQEQEFQNGRQTPNSIPPVSPCCSPSPPASPAASPEQVEVARKEQEPSQSLCDVSPATANDDEGELLEEGESKEQRSPGPRTPPMETKKKPRTPPSSPEIQEDRGRKRDKRLNKLKTMRFTAGNIKEAFSARDGQDKPARQVRSFLHEKGSEGLDQLLNAPPTTRSRKRSRSNSPDERRRKRRYEDDDRDNRREKENAIRESSVNPNTLMTKIHAMLLKGDAPGGDVAEEDLKATVMEVLLLDSELSTLYNKRDMLKTQMEEMIVTEKASIRKIRDELPVHMQNVVKIEGDNFTINDAPILAHPPFGMPSGMFPAIPSMLNGNGFQLPPGMPPLPPGMTLPPGLPPPFGLNGNSFRNMPPPTANLSVPPPSTDGLIRDRTPSPELAKVLAANNQTEAIDRRIPPAHPTVVSAENITWTSETVNYQVSSTSFTPGSLPNLNVPPPVPVPSTDNTNPTVSLADFDFSKPPPIPIPKNNSSTSLSTSTAPEPMNFSHPPPSFDKGPVDRADSPSAYQNAAINRSIESSVSRANIPTSSSITTTIDLSKTITNLITNALKVPGIFTPPGGSSPMKPPGPSHLAHLPHGAVLHGPPPMGMLPPRGPPGPMGLIQLGPPNAQLQRPIRMNFRSKNRHNRRKSGQQQQNKQ